MEKYLGIEVSRSQTERVTKHYADLIGQSEEEQSTLQESQEEKAKDLRGDLEQEGHVYAMLDGAMLATREGAAGNDWKEVKVGRIFSQESLYELDKHHNWIKDSIYSAHLGTYDEFLLKFEALTDLFAPLAERLVFIADGATWIWRWIEESYPQATQILDYYHGVEHLAKFAKTHFKSKKQRKKWLEQQKAALLNDEIQQVIKNLKALSPKGKKVQAEQEKLLNYLQKNEHRMLYKSYKEMGYNIGSGAIESAHRTVIQKRLKQSGQRWTMTGAQNIIDLRLMNMNGQWNNVINLIKDIEVHTFLSKSKKLAKTG